MHTQTIFQVGNSHVVSIPAHIMKSMKFKKGQKVVVDEAPQMGGVIVRPATKKSFPKKSSEKEFQSWLDRVLEEDKEIIDELALR